MATLSLFSGTIKGEPLTPYGEWQHYFNAEDFVQLAQELDKYQKAGYLEFDEKTEKVLLLNGHPPTHGEPFTSQHVISFVIKEIDVTKARSDLTKYLKSWCNDRLLTKTAYKPDNSTYQHKKLLTALARVHERHSMPRVNLTDIFGDNNDHEPPFWETVLAPQLVDNQYEIRQMGYGVIDSIAQPFVDIEIIDPELQQSLKKTQPAELVTTEWAELRLNKNTAYIRLEYGGQYRLKKFRTDSAPLNFINYVITHSDTDITRADIQTRVDGCVTKENMTELARQCGFTIKLLPLKDVFFSGTTEKKVHFVSRALLTTRQVDLIKLNLTKSD